MTATLASTVPAPPPVRMRPVPVTEPPYEDPHHGRPTDETARRIGPHDVELPLDWGPARSRRGRGVGRPRSRRTDKQTADRLGPAGWRAMGEDLPRVIRRFVDLYVEVLNDRRPLLHLLPHTSNEAFGGIRLTMARRGGTRWPVNRRPPRRAQRQAAGAVLGATQIRVQRLRFCAPCRGVVEVTAVLRGADEVRAVALRLEQEHRRWICTALEFVG